MSQLEPFLDQFRAEPAVFTPVSGESFFFGEQCVLLNQLSALLSYRDGTAVHDVLQTLVSASPSQLAGLYGLVERNGDDVNEQGPLIIAGVSRALRYAVTRNRATESERREAIREAIYAFDRAFLCDCGEARIESQWTAGPQTLRSEFLADSEGCERRLGHWLAWDIVSLIGDGSDASAAQGTPAARSPSPIDGESVTALLFDEGLFSSSGDTVNQAGNVARLKVDLVQDGGSLFVHDPFYLGMTAISRRGQHAWHPGFQEVWNRSGLGRRCRGRWWLSPLAGSRLNTPSLDGRSLQAALMCALLTLKRRLEHPDEARDWKVDPEIAVTAALDMQASVSDIEQIPLIPVDGIREKLKAALQKGLFGVIVARNQKPDELDTDPEFNGLDIFRADTVGDACHRLTSMIRQIRRFQRLKREEWDARWMSEEEARAQLDAIDGQPVESGVADSAAE